MTRVYVDLETLAPGGIRPDSGGASRAIAPEPAAIRKLARRTLGRIRRREA